MRLKTRLDRLEKQMDTQEADLNAALSGKGTFVVRTDEDAQLVRSRCKLSQPGGPLAIYRRRGQTQEEHAAELEELRREWERDPRPTFAGLKRLGAIRDERPKRGLDWYFRKRPTQEASSESH